MPEIKITPEHFRSNPSEIKYSYLKSSDRTLWNVSEISDGIVKLWTLNAWGRFYYESCPESDFSTRFREFNCG